MNMLVTGGAGFIGSNLVELLLEKGHNVIVVDNLHTGSLENLKGFPVKFIKKASGDLSPEDIPEVDGIFHLGIYSSSPMYRKSPGLVGEAVKEFLTMLELADTFQVKMVWASTSSVYNGNTPPWSEAMPIYVTDYYSEARYYMERLAHLHHEWHGTRSIALRLFSVYGPGEEAKKIYANLASQFLWCMKEGESPVLFGDGTQKRDFTYVKDVTACFLRAFESDIDHDIFNVGTGVSYSLNQLVSIINEILKTDISPVYKKNVIKGYIDETLADTSKTERILKWEAAVSLKEGIEKLNNMLNIDLVEE